MFAGLRTPSDLSEMWTPHMLGLRWFLAGGFSWYWCLLWCFFGFFTFQPRRFSFLVSRWLFSRCFARSAATR